MGKNYEVGSEAPDIIYCTADDLFWEWEEEFAQLDLPLEFNLSDIEIVDSEEQTQKEIESFRKRLDEPEI